MTPPAVLDFERLLAPLSDDNPCGIQETSVESIINQFRIKEGKWLERGHNDVDATTRQEIRELLTQCQDVFSQECKSILLPIYAAGLMLQEYGLVGLRDVLEWIRQLHTAYPDDFFPRAVGKRVRVIDRALTSRLGEEGGWTPVGRQLLLLPVTQSPESVPLRYAALRVHRSKAAGRDEPEFPKEYVEQAERTPPDFFLGLNRLTAEVIQLSEEVNRLVREAYCAEYPEFTRMVSTDFLELLREFKSVISRLATRHCPHYTEDEDGGAAESEEVADSTGGGVATASPSAAPAGGLSLDGEIVDRDQAVRLLQKVADYFRRTEKHSPVGYRLQETVEWTRLDLPDLLMKLLDADSDQVQRLATRIGFNVEFKED